MSEVKWNDRCEVFTVMIVSLRPFYPGICGEIAMCFVNKEWLQITFLASTQCDVDLL